MDSFLMKTPRLSRPTKKGCTDRTVGTSSSENLQQSTIHSLQGVVVVEDIKRLKTKLQLPTQSESVLLECLKELGKKVPPRSVLMATKVGFAVKRLKKHPNKNVACAAKQVYQKWRNFFEEFKSRPQIEVKYDKKTEDMRLRTKSFLSEALKLERTNDLVDNIEFEVFHQHERRINPSYMRTMRRLVFKLKNSEELRISLAQGNSTVEDLVKQHIKH